MAKQKNNTTGLGTKMAKLENNYNTGPQFMSGLNKGLLQILRQHRKKRITIPKCYVNVKVWGSKTIN